MSLKLLTYIKTFLDGDIEASEFVDIYQKIWKEERDSKQLLKDDNVLSEVLSTTFCLSDMYNSDVDRRDTEFDDEELAIRINSLLKANNL